MKVRKRRAGKRRALGAIIWAWVFAISGGAMTLFFTWQLIWPTIVPRSEGWQALMASLFIGIGLTRHMLRVAHRSTAAPELLPPSTTSVLYLRAFGEEHRPFALGPRSVLWKYTSQYAAHTPFSRGDPTIKLTLEDYLEEAITARIGPFVGLGNPHDTQAPDGATREYAPDDQWQARFLDLARSARCIVVTIGGSANLEWELKELKAQGLGEKLCLFTPPIVPGHDNRFRSMLARSALKRARAIEAEWAKSTEILRRAGFSCGPNPGAGAAITFDSEGRSSVITSDAEWPDDFIAPVADWFKDGRRSGRCVPATCRSCRATTHVTAGTAPEAALCYACRQKEALAGKAFFQRHPLIAIAWASVTFAIAVTVTAINEVRSFTLVLLVWFLLWIPPVALSWVWRPKSESKHPPES